MRASDGCEFFCKPQLSLSMTLRQNYSRGAERQTTNNTRYFSRRWCDLIFNDLILKTLKRRFRSPIRQAVPRPDGIRVEHHSRSRTKTLAVCWKMQNNTAQLFLS
ncbi:unnamed protein product [Ectocarpus sp. 6 AP-2014]